MATNDIITGQYVTIEQTTASVGERIVARIVDYAFLAAYSIAMLYLFSHVDLANSDLQLIAYVAVAYLPVVLYSLLCETLFAGQTLGKAVVGTRVVMADGSQPTMGASLLRWVLMLVDVYCSFVGLVFIVCSRKRQRLGDMAAGTIVIAKPKRRDMHLQLSDFRYARADYRPAYAQAARLSYGQAELIRRTLDTLRPDNAVRADALANKVQQVLGIERRQPDAATFLTTILYDYQYFALQLV